MFDHAPAQMGVAINEHPSALRIRSTRHSEGIRFSHKSLELLTFLDEEKRLVL